MTGLSFYKNNMFQCKLPAILYTNFSPDIASTTSDTFLDVWMFEKTPNLDILNQR